MSKITNKLIVMFGIVISSYALILAFNFSHFTNDVLNTHHVDVIKRGVENMASTFEDLLPDSTTTDNFLEQIKNNDSFKYALKTAKDISDYHYFIGNQANQYVNLNDEYLIEDQNVFLLSETKQVQQKAINGESFCIELPEPQGHIIVGAAPIHNQNQEVVGIVLIQHQANDSLQTQATINQFIFTLTTITLLIVFIACVILSSRFTAPIRRITHIANELAHGNLNIQTNIKGKDEIGQLAYSMDQLAIELRKSKEIQENEIQIHDKFLADISHELKTPVTVMRGSLESLVDGVIKSKEDIALYHQQMLTESKYLQKLIQDILMISTLKTKEFKINHDIISVSEIMSDTAMSARSMAIAKKIDFISEAPEHDTFIEGDYELVRKLLMIVLDNAIKYTETGKKIYYYQSDKDLIVIKDEGCGIESEDLSHIFERFYRHDKKINEGSSGLGLALAKEIANRHHIQLEITSEINLGTTFILHLPIQNENSV